MPLRNHFKPPLKGLRPWESIHAMWTTNIAEQLNTLLPEGFFAVPEVHAGANVQIDVATWGRDESGWSAANGHPHNQGANSFNGNGGSSVAVLPDIYAPPAVEVSFDSAFADDFEIRVYRDPGGFKLAAAIELISPGNKDRVESRTAFATKCASYLHNGVAVIVVDVVTDRSANLHDEIVPLITTRSVEPLGEGVVCAVAYRPIRRQGKDQIDVWPRTLAVGDVLPTLPLWLNAVQAVPVDLEATYLTALRRTRIE